MLFFIFFVLNFTILCIDFSANYFNLLTYETDALPLHNIT